MSEIAYKALKDGKAPITGFKWPLPHGKRPGKWVKVEGEPVLCKNGLHGWIEEPRAWAESEQVYEMEVAGATVRDGQKLATTRARLLRQITYEDREPLKHGDRLCLDCGEIHDLYPAPGGYVSWASRKDGHPYRQEPAERTIARLHARIAELESLSARLAGKFAVEEHTDSLRKLADS